MLIRALLFDRPQHAARFDRSVSRRPFASAIQGRRAAARRMSSSSETPTTVNSSASSSEKALRRVHSISGDRLLAVVEQATELVEDERAASAKRDPLLAEGLGLLRVEPNIDWILVDDGDLQDLALGGRHSLQLHAADDEVALIRVRLQRQPVAIGIEEQVGVPLRGVRPAGRVVEPSGIVNGCFPFGDEAAFREHAVHDRAEAVGRQRGEAPGPPPAWPRHIRTACNRPVAGSRAHGPPCAG